MSNLMLNNNFNKILNKKFNLIRKIDILLSVDFPILFSFNSNGKYFLGYVLEFKRLTPKLEIYFVETTIDNLIFLLESKISLNKILESTNSLCVNLEEELDANSEVIQKKLPKNDFYLTPLIPNSIDIEKSKNLLIESEKKHENFNYNSIEERNFYFTQSSSELNYIETKNKLVNSDLEILKLPIIKSLEIVKNKEHLEETDKYIIEKYVKQFFGVQKL